MAYRRFRIFPQSLEDSDRSRRRQDNAPGAVVSATLDDPGQRDSLHPINGLAQYEKILISPGRIELRTCAGGARCGNMSASFAGARGQG
jgi:hypothetical protein